MLFDDPFRHRQPQPGPFSFGRKERMKNLLPQFSGNAAPRILNRDGNRSCLFVMACPDGDCPALANRLGGVQQQVKEHLLKLLSIAENLRQMIIQFPDDPLARTTSDEMKDAFL